MALVPCNVCGTLNSDQAEICLSCEFPIKGRRRPVIFQWAAVVLAFCFALPLLFMVVNWFQHQQQPQPSPPVFDTPTAEAHGIPLSTT